MPSLDPVHALAHDHAELNRRVLAISARIEAMRGGSASAHDLLDVLEELREPLFLHFAQEEEGLFPFVAEVDAGLDGRVHEMEVAHDAICGALARMCQLASMDASLSSLATLFERFEAAYARHARTETELLEALDRRLDDGHRRRLAELVNGL